MHERAAGPRDHIDAVRLQFTRGGDDRTCRRRIAAGDLREGYVADDAIVHREAERLGMLHISRHQSMAGVQAENPDANPGEWRSAPAHRAAPTGWDGVTGMAAGEAHCP